LKSQFNFAELQGNTAETMPLEVQVNVLIDLVRKVMDEASFKASVQKYKLQKDINSKDIFKRVYALNVPHRKSQ
jgi:hypothetical protein